LRVEPVWVPAEAVVEFNRREVMATGEPFSLDRPELLHSAIASPQQHFHYADEDDVLTLALVLLFALVRNHPFQQGNKRTAFIAAVTFLEANGYMLSAVDGEYLGEMIVKVIEGGVSEELFRSSLEKFVTPL
jgi:death-on-curing protein